MRVKISNRPGHFIIDDCDLHFLGNSKWSIGGNGGYIGGQVKGKRVDLHRVIMNAQKGQMIDHIDGDKLNNQRSNLRFCTYAENKMNSQKHRTNRSGYKGVSRSGKNHWKASLKKDGSHIYLGQRSSPKEAALLYDAAARTYFGEFAKTNFAE